MKTFEIGLRKSTRITNPKLPPKISPTQNTSIRKKKIPIILKDENLTPRRKYLQKKTAGKYRIY